MRNPYVAAQHSTKKTPVTEAKPIGPIRRVIRRFLLWVVGVLQGHPVWPYPLEQFFALEDRPDRIYVWSLHESLSDGDAQELAAQFAGEFIRKFHREPRAVHIMTPDVESIRRLTREEAERFIVPAFRQEVQA